MADTRTTAGSLKKDLSPALPALYHYTCGHAAASIRQGGRLLSSVHQASPMERMRLQMQASPTMRFGSQVVWLTTLPDLHRPDQLFCGEPIWESDCDRTAFRFRAAVDQGAVPWSEVRNIWPMIVVADLESAPNARPDTWWISGGPVVVDQVTVAGTAHLAAINVPWLS